MVKNAAEEWTVHGDEKETDDARFSEKRRANRQRSILISHLVLISKCQGPRPGHLFHLLYFNGRQIYLKVERTERHRSSAPLAAHNCCINNKKKRESGYLECPSAHYKCVDLFCIAAVKTTMFDLMVVQLHNLHRSTGIHVLLFRFVRPPSVSNHLSFSTVRCIFVCF